MGNLEKKVPKSSIFGIRNTLQDKVLWGSKLLNIDEFQLKSQGEGVMVAVLDTGADTHHPDLKDAIVKTKSFADRGPVSDGNGHGTHCAGIIGARANNYGIVGVAPKCKFIIGKVLADNGSGNNNWISDGIIWAAEQGANVINMSLGSNYPSPTIEKAVKEAYKINKRCVIVAAAGNDGEEFPDSVNHPAALEEVISVGAVCKDSQWAYFSSIGHNLDFVAPGHDVYSTFPKSKYKSMSGTSMATPFVSGICALVISLKNLIKRDLKRPFYVEVRELLKTMAVDLGDVGRDPKYGFGIIKF